MKDVASRAGVALKTVSRVVNGESGVTPETASRVHGAIDDLGFRRNEAARLLRTGHTATVGFIADTWADPEQAAVYRGFEHIAQEHGYLLYTGSADGDPGREERLALAMCARRVDGLVISPVPGAHDYLLAEIEAGVAAVYVLRPPELVRADTVLPDECGGARAAIAYLVARGHRKIGFLGAPAGHRSRTLRAGYTQAMAAAGLPVDPAWAALDSERLAGSRGDRALLRGPGADSGGAPGARPQEHSYRRIRRLRARRLGLATRHRGELRSGADRAHGRRTAPAPPGRGPGTAPPGGGSGQTDRPVELDEQVARGTRPRWRRSPR